MRRIMPPRRGAWNYRVGNMPLNAYLADVAAVYFLDAGLLAGVRNAIFLLYGGSVAEVSDEVYGALSKLVSILPQHAQGGGVCTEVIEAEAFD